MKLKIHTLFFLFIYFSIFNTKLYGIYLLVIEDESGYIRSCKAMSIELQKQAYNSVLMKYDYPMCLALPSQEEFDVLFGDDPLLVDQYINKELYKIDPQLKALWVPSTLWELFVLNYYFQNEEFKQYIQELGFICGFYDKNSDTQQKQYQHFSKNTAQIKRIHPDIDSNIPSIMSNPNKTRQDLYAEFHSRNCDPIVCKFYLQINHAFIDQFCKNQQTTLRELQTLPIEQCNLLRLIAPLPLKVEQWKEYGLPFTFIASDPLDEDLSRHIPSLVQVFNDELIKSKNNEIGLLQRLIEEEQSARIKNEALIYRGAPIETIQYLDKNIDLAFLPFIANDKNRNAVQQLANNCASFSLSYGNSFFGGIFLSVDTCAARYSQLLRQPYTFHLLALDKRSLRDENESLFMIPLLSPFTDMMTDGEWHHVHSRTGMICPYRVGAEFTTELNDSLIKDYQGFLLNPRKTAQKIGIELFQLFSQQARVVKFNNQIFPQASNNREKQLLDNHAQFASHLSLIFPNVKAVGCETSTSQNKFFQIISQKIQNDILPFYRIPFPPKPSYFDNIKNERMELLDPFWGYTIDSYSKYIGQINLKEMPPRSAHGLMHATRTAIWTKLLANIYERTKKVKIPNQDILVLAGAAHDIAREDEGEDFWNTESAVWFKEYLLSQGYPNELAKSYFFFIHEKDPQSGFFTFPEQEIIHDADVLEFYREVMDTTEFQKEKLCFYGFHDLDILTKNAIIEEIHYVIRVTENPKIKLLFEYRSHDYLNHILQLITMIHRTEKKLPYLALMLELDNICLEDDPSSIAFQAWTIIYP